MLGAYCHIPINMRNVRSKQTQSELMKSIGVTAARSNLAAILKQAQGSELPIVIERRGKNLAALVSMEDLELIERGRAAREAEDRSALQESLDLFSRTERLARLGHWEWDEVGDKCLYCSEELARIHGVSVDEYLRLTNSFEADLNWVHPEDRDRVAKIASERLANKQGFDIEFRLLRADGEVLEVREVAETVLDNTGNLVRSVGFVQDISDRKQAERKLRESEALLARAQRLASVGSWRWDVRKNELISCSEEFARIHGVELDEVHDLLDWRKDSVVHPDDRERVEREFAYFDETGIDYEIEYRVVRPDGEIRHVVEIGEPILGADGQVVEQIGTVQDVTAQKEVEEELVRAYGELDRRVQERTEELTKSEQAARQTQQLLTDAIEALDEGFALFDREGRLLRWNARYVEIFAALEDAIKPGVSFETLLRTARDRNLFAGTENDTEEFIAQRVADHQNACGRYQANLAANRWIWIRDRRAADGSTITTFSDITELKHAELELQQSEARLTDAIESISDGFILFDANERLVLCNEKYREYYSKIADIMVPGTPLVDLLQAAAERGQAADAPGNENSWLQMRLDHYRECAGTYEHRLPDGRWILASERRTKEGGIVGIRTEFTERKRAQEDLRAREEQLRLITDNLPALITYVDRDLRYGFANKACESWFGRDARGIIGKTTEEIHGANFAQFKPHVEQALAGELVTWDQRTDYPDGKSRHVELMYIPHFDEDDRVLGFIALVQDISERMRAQEALHASEKQMRLITDNLPALISYVDNRQRIAFVNRVYETWHGRKPKDILGRSVEEIMGPQFRKIRHHVEKALAGNYVTFEEGLHFRDGQHRYVQVTYIPHKDDAGNVLGFFVLSMDITDRRHTAEELQLSVRRLNDIAEAASDWFWELDADLRFTYVSDRYEEVAGVSPNLLLGKRPEEVYPRSAARQADIWREYFSAVRSQKDFRDFTHDDFRRDGERRVIRNTGKAIFTEDGLFVGYRGTSTDITVQRKAEEAQQISEQRFRSVVENSPSAVFLKDAEGRFQLVNPRFEAWYGVTQSEMLGKTSRDIFPDVFANHYLALDEEVLRTSNVCEREFQVPFADGTLHWVLATKFPVVSADQQVTGVVTINTDITERKQAEAALRETEGLLHSVIANSPAVMFVKDLEGRHKLINPTFEEELNVRAEDALGKTDGDFMPDHLAEMFIAQDRKVVESGEVLDEEVELEHDHGVRIIHAVKFPLRDANDEIIGIGGITNDITQHRRVEEQLRQAQKMEAIGQLTGGLAHDFNNLLAIVTGHIELLERDLGDRDENIRVIKDTSDRGAKLINRLLAFSRQQSLQPTNTNLDTLVSGMLDLFRRTLGETIQIEFRMEKAPWPVMVDQARVENALLNLVINARHAMPRGGQLEIQVGNVTVDQTFTAAHSGAHSGDYVKLAVSDNGTGMSRDVLERAFEPFFTTRDVGKGTGLGLSMVYGFAEQSGGFLTADSEEGVGTTVTIFLPRTERQSVDTDLRVPGDEPVADGGTILVVEDEEAVRSLVARTLDDLGYDVMQAADGPAAIALLEQTNQIDLLLSDVVLPGGMSGPELAQRAMRDRPDLKILFMSGYAEKALEQHGLPSGIFLLNKPFERQDLAQKISATIANRSSHQAALQ